MHTVHSIIKNFGGFFMANRAFQFRFICITLIALFTLSVADSMANNGVNLYTPYTKISVPPGESVDYTVEVKNSSTTTKDIYLYLSGLPGSWSYSLKAGGYDIQQISILPGEKKTIKLKVDVPLKVNKGNHLFRVVAKNFDVLPLTINVSEKGTYNTEFTSDQVNMQGHAKSKFNFTTKLKNQTAEKQVYSLHASPPKGWNVIFKPNYKQATAVEIEPNSTSNISIEVNPPFNVKAGTYKIPVGASNRSTSAELELEVVITGTYELELTTPSGLMSMKTTAGREKQLEFAVVNTGSVELSNIVFRASKPKNWEVSFRPDTVPHLNAGETVHVMAKIKAYEKAIPGDYVSTFTASTSEANSSASFRISVKTSLLWGWMGILIVLITLAVIFYLFRKFGRR